MRADDRIEFFFKNVRRKLFGIQRVGIIDGRTEAHTVDGLTGLINRAEHFRRPPDDAVVSTGNRLFCLFTGKGNRIAAHGFDAPCMECFGNGRRCAVVAFACAAGEKKYFLFHETPPFFWVKSGSMNGVILSSSIIPFAAEYVNR